MRYTWTEEQQQMRDTLGEFFAERYSFAYRRRRIAQGFDSSLWAQLAELGLLGVPFEEEYGGSGGNALDLLLVMEALGRAIAVEPYVASVVLGGGLVRRAGNASQRAQLLSALIAGKLRLAFAFAEQNARYNLAHVETQAVARDGGFAISGRKIVVYGAPECDQLIVAVRTSGAASSRAGISLVLVPADAPGVALRPYHTIDGMAAAEATFADVRVGPDALLGEPGAALAVMEVVVDEAIVALCGEAAGAMAALNEKCVRHAQEREAFGAPLAAFQVISHRLVDMQVAAEQSAAMALKAAAALAAGAPDRARLVSAAKVKAGEEGAFIGKHAVQLHGAMGMTDELDIGHYFKRLLAIRTLFGDVDYHLRRYAALRAGDEDGR